MHRCSWHCFTSVFFYFFGSWVLLNASACCYLWSLCPVMLPHLCNKLPTVSPPDSTRYCKSVTLPSSLLTNILHWELKLHSSLLTNQTLKVCITKKMNSAHILEVPTQMWYKIVSSLSQNRGLSLQTSPYTLSGRVNLEPHQSDSSAPWVASFQTNWVWIGNGTTNLSPLKVSIRRWGVWRKWG